MESIRILLVEDDPDIVNLLETSLERQYECLRAANGLEALQLALEGDPDLIISDIMMPVMDGHEMVRRLRQFPALESLPVIFLSALGSPANVKQGYSEGASLYLTKPVDPTRFRRNVDLFVDDHGITPREKRRSVRDVQLHLAPLKEPPRPAKAPHQAPRVFPLAQDHPESAGGRAAPTAAPAPAPPPRTAKAQPPVEAATPAAAPQSRAAKTEPQAEPTEARVRVLIADDDPAMRTAIVENLEGEYEVIAALDGIDAVEKAARYMPDIFVISAAVSKMTGYQLAGMIRKNATFAGAPIIFASDKEGGRDEQYVKRLGVKYFLPKPCDPGQIRHCIEEATKEPGFSIRQERMSYRLIIIELSSAGSILTPASELFRVAQVMKTEKMTPQTLKPARDTGKDTPAPRDTWQD